MIHAYLRDIMYNVSVLLMAVLAAGLAVRGVSGWGWFLFFAYVIFIVHVSSKDDNELKPKNKMDK
jgi:hypothetical protein